jgi:hypothetical protein
MALRWRVRKPRTSAAGYWAGLCAEQRATEYHATSARGEILQVHVFRGVIAQACNQVPEAHDFILQGICGGKLGPENSDEYWEEIAAVR